MSRLSLIHSRNINLFASIFIAIPFVIYYMIVNHYIVDIPTLDDYVNPLDMTNKAILASTLKEKLSFLVTPMNGHIPFLPRALLYIQYLIGITSAIKTALIISNVGWMITALLILIYCHRSYKVPLVYLIPIPYFLLSVAHWMAMDFYSAAFQMYWGSGLLAVIGLIAITANRPVFASLCFLAGLFCSGGTLAVYPVCFLFLLLTKQWKNSFLFLICTVPIAWLYVHVSPPTDNLRAFPNILMLGRYTLEFIGNILSTAQWDAAVNAPYHVAIGVLLVIVGAYHIYKIKGNHAFKLIFLYIIIMGAMAGYMRMGDYNHVVSRYAMYAQLAATCIYILLVLNQLSEQSSAKKYLLIIIALFSIGVWLQSLMLSTTLLKANHDQRVNSMKTYIESGNPDALVSWNAQQAKEVLDTAKKIGLYDYTKSLP